MKTTDNVIRHYTDNSYWFIPPFDYHNPEFVFCLKHNGRIIARIVNYKSKKA